MNIEQALGYFKKHQEYSTRKTKSGIRIYIDANNHKDYSELEFIKLCFWLKEENNDCAEVLQ